MDTKTLLTKWYIYTQKATTIIIIFTMLLSFSNCRAQATIGTERINALCDSIEKDFHTSVYAKIPQQYKDIFPLVDGKIYRSGFACYLQYAYLSEPSPFQEITEINPVITSQTVSEGRLLRIGEGHLKWADATSFYSSKRMIPENPTETVYYFLNNTLAKILVTQGFTDYNSDPALYWINIVSSETVFSTEDAGKTCFYWNGDPYNNENVIQSWKERLSQQNIHATPERAYQLLKLMENKE